MNRLNQVLLIALLLTMCLTVPDLRASRFPGGAAFNDQAPLDQRVEAVGALIKDDVVFYQGKLAGLVRVRTTPMSLRKAAVWRLAMEPLIPSLMAIYQVIGDETDSLEIRVSTLEALSTFASEATREKVMGWAVVASKSPVAPLRSMAAIAANNMNLLDTLSIPMLSRLLADSDTTVVAAAVECVLSFARGLTPKLEKRCPSAGNVRLGEGALLGSLSDLAPFREPLEKLSGRTDLSAGTQAKCTEALCRIKYKI